MPVEHRADRHPLRAQFLRQLVLVIAHRVPLDAFVHLPLVLVARAGGIEPRIGEPILESHRAAEVLEPLGGLLDHYIYIGVLIGLPTLRAIAPAQHQTALGVGRTRNRLAPLVIRIAVIIGEPAQTVEDQLVAQLDTA